MSNKEYEITTCASSQNDTTLRIAHGNDMQKAVGGGDNSAIICCRFMITLAIDFELVVYFNLNLLQLCFKVDFFFRTDP